MNEAVLAVESPQFVFSEGAEPAKNARDCREWVFSLTVTPQVVGVRPLRVLA